MAERGAPLGNQNASKAWTLALRRAMAHKANGDYQHTLLQIASGVVDKALEGDKDAWREIAEREEGKAMQAMQLSNPEGEAFRVAAIDQRIVDPKDADPRG